MRKIIELYTHGSYSLVITSLAAGRIGASDERFNRNRLEVLNAAGINPDEVISAVQRHTKKVIDASEWCPDPQSEADGVVSGSSKDTIGVTVADCMPVYLYNDKIGVRALLHSGWKGTGIALEALNMMKLRYGSRPEDTTAVLGPAIGSCCYNVDEQRARFFSSTWGNGAVREADGSVYLSLKAANKAMLEKVRIGGIVDKSSCTCCSDIYGSYRREGPEKFTQMMVLSYLNEDR